jgi:hypothetical protein
VTLGSLGVHRFQKLGSVIGDGDRDGGDGGDGAGRLGGTRRLLPVVIGGGSGPTKASVAVRLLFSKIASRPRTARNTQPWYPSPILRLNGGLSLWSEKMPTLTVLPATTPNSVSRGRSGSGGSAGGGGGGGGTYGAATTAGGGGRRDGEKIGRSRVADSDVKGSDQSGFPELAGAVGTGSRRIANSDPRLAVMVSEKIPGRPSSVDSAKDAAAKLPNAHAKTCANIHFAFRTAIDPVPTHHNCLQ